ncbi:arginine decarboxylase [Sulfobacillus harzensis]|uniref:Arginine decarboxylase n=1 Tax=Sulfobacillus harzensis TaxID=2729629 RepID=A0A7Y0L551_9FIRM|nr:arginine decarboxylase [Sulfobacillus harzensis]NMP23380.1 arginine decarboxylase [Sulfobacillus harzensis]
MDTPILDMLRDYVRQQRERWHTPGHKGIQPAQGDFLDWAFDITEIGPMHHHPTPVERSEALMAASFSVRRSWYSVQGATLPVIAAILAANPPGSTLLVDRSMHRSVLTALMIGGYRVEWLWPPVLEAGVLLPLEDFPESFAGASGLVIARPTYDGLAADVRESIQRAHAKGLNVVVDEAHGSHWRGASFPTSAIDLGADLIIHGVHKSDAALTQTGLLHLNSQRIKEEAVDRWMQLLATTSPSYLLLASLDRLQWERRQPTAQEDWQRFAGRMKELWNTLEKRGVHVLQPWAERRGLEADPARLTILGPGPELAEAVAAFGELEKTSPGSATFFVSPHQDLGRLIGALEDIGTSGDGGLSPIMLPRPPVVLSVRETWGRSSRWVPLKRARSLVLAEAITPYPPGIPVAIPGEQVSEDVKDWVLWWHGTGRGHIEGVRQEDGQLWIAVLE